MVRLAFVGTAGLVVADEVVRFIDELAAHELALAGETVLDLAALDSPGEFWAAVRDDRGLAWLTRRRLDGSLVGDKYALDSTVGRLLVTPQTNSIAWISDRPFILAG